MLVKSQKGGTAEQAREDEAVMAGHSEPAIQRKTKGSRTADSALSLLWNVPGVEYDVDDYAQR